MIEIQNLNHNFKRIDKKALTEAAELLFKRERIKKSVEISVVIVTPEEIRGYNKKYRKKDSPTDVLSFGSIEGYLSKDDFVLPEIIICPEEVKKNSEEDKTTFKHEMVKVFVHGMLHLLGFDHEEDEASAKQMFDKQEKYLSLIFNKKLTTQNSK
jgi:probable rRNA maturation factor